MLCFEVTPSNEIVWQYTYPGVAGPNVKYVLSDSNNAYQIGDNQNRGGGSHPGPGMNPA